MTQTVEKTDIGARLAHVDDIFALPQVLAEVLQAVDRDDTSAEKLASAIMHDPNLTAKILKMANSSYYRRESEISTVHQAIVMLGLSMVKCLALSVSVFQPDQCLKSMECFDIRELYSSITAVAIASKLIAEEIGYAKPEEAFVAGLLHDFGHLYLLKTEPDSHIPLLNDHFYSHDLIDVEQQTYGMNHAQIGKFISRKWGLPACLQSAIGNHHMRVDSENIHETDKLDLIVILADHLSCRVYSNQKQNIERYLETVKLLTDSLKLRKEFVGELSFKLATEMMKASEFLGIDIGDPMKIMQRANRGLFESYCTIERLFRERQELSKRVLEEERRVGMMRSKNIAIATLSHYINNAATIISGRTQLLQLTLESGEITDKSGKLNGALSVIDTSLCKIMAVLSELKDLTSLDNGKFYNDSDALNIDENVRLRMEEMEGKFGLEPILTEPEASLD
jgi:HD-like signal output (HDOD) protein